MRSAKQDNLINEPDGLIDALKSIVSYHVRKPANVAWSVGVIGAVGFVFSNALFFQQGAHPAAFFETRGQNSEHGLQRDERQLPINKSDVATKDSNDAKPVTRIVFEPGAEAVPMPAARPQPSQKIIDAVQRTENQLAAEQKSQKGNSLLELQGLLAELGFYKGEIDGLDGPQTRAAIEAYKANVGLRGIELTYGELVTSTKNNLIVTAAIPKTRPEEVQQNQNVTVEPRQVKTISYTPPTPQSVAAQPSSTIIKVQAGLRAFGNESITVDGVAGTQTTQAIQEFQELFKLPVTGKIDNELVSKMKDVGLID